MRFALVLLTACTALAQDARVEGRVLTPDGTPVPKATVYLAGISGTQGKTYVEATARDGSFVADHLPPGTYAVSAHADGYQEPPSPPAAHEFSLAAGELRRGVEYRLSALVHVSGVVVDATDAPVAGMTVELSRPSYSRFGSDLLSSGAATTDEQGRFRLAKVVPGVYYVRASEFAEIIVSSWPHSTVIPGPSVRPLRPTFYPNALRRQDAEVIRVDSSSLEDLVIRMRQDRGHTVRGRSETEWPMLHVVTQDGSDAGAQISPEPNGEFEIQNLLPGRYSIIATQLREPATHPIARAEVVMEDKDIGGVTLPLRESLTLTVKLSLESDGGSTPLQAGHPVFGTPMGFGLIEPRDTVNPSFDLKDDGTIRVEGLWPARYYITSAPMVGTANATVKEIRLGKQDLLREPLDLTHGIAEPIEIIYTTAETSLQVRLKNPSPTATTVSVWSARPILPLLHQGAESVAVMGNEVAAVKALYSHSIPFALPDTYYAIAWEEKPPQDLALNRAFLQYFQDAAAKVALTEGSRATLEAPLISRDAMRRALETFR